jgi:hypothetical protein
MIGVRLYRDAKPAQYIRAVLTVLGPTSYGLF